MSTELAITTVTRTLRQILEKEVPAKMGIAADVVQPLQVTTLPPQKVRDIHKSDNVINLYLYRTEVNAAWRNQPIPASGPSAPPPLALNLEYLICTYGEGEREDIAHYYLGAAMRVMHDCAIVPRAKLAAEVEGKGLVHQQLENIRVSPRGFSIEEISKLWSVLGAQYRISAAYNVTVLLIDSRTKSASGPPVLRQGADDRGPVAMTTPPPTLDAAKPASGFRAVRLGEDLLIEGENLEGGTAQAFLRHPALKDPKPWPATIVSGVEATIAIPAAVPASGVSKNWPSGVWTVALEITRPNQPKWTTNEVPFALAPSITISPASINTPNAPFTLTINATPMLRDGQTALVLFDDQQTPPKTATTAPGDDSPTVIKADVQGDVGKHLVRLRVDGIDSIPIIKTNDQLDFDPTQSVEVT